MTIDAWLAALEQRHMADLTFSEVTRGLRALSSTYVERRDRLDRRSALDSTGKRAAYALYYSPLHFLTVSRILDALPRPARPPAHILDVGCGAGAAGAAWAAQPALPPGLDSPQPGRTSQPHRPPAVTGIDAHPWAVAEAGWTYRQFGLKGDTRRVDAARLEIRRSVDAIVAGWTLNELNDDTRAAVKTALVEAAHRRVRILIVEPIATSVSPWWDDWAQTFTPLGGRADEWRFRDDWPALLNRLARAAGLRHEELKARSLAVWRS